MDGLPPDPYAALAVSRDAPIAEIKKRYRKLALQFHPDKVTDAALKESAADEFHKVQTAYDIVGDEDRRARYDAQYNLLELRREKAERERARPRGGADFRMPSYRASAEDDFYERSGRMSPRYEEREPRFDSYFDLRSSPKRDPDYERSSKRAPPREDSKKPKTSAKKSKDNERSNREERARRKEQEERRERERKFASVHEQSPSSDSDDRKRATKLRFEEEERRAREIAQEQARLREQAQVREAYLGEERARKSSLQESSAREYMAQALGSNKERSHSDRRPSPVRKGSSRDTVDFIKRDNKPAMVRRGSARPDSGRTPRKSSSNEKDIHIVEEPQEAPRRPPMLNKSTSSPPVVRPPYQRQRSSSLQYDDREAAPAPGIRRAETMPYPYPSASPVDSRRKESSKLRTEIPQDYYPTPEASPEPTSAPRKSSYGHAYADEYTSSPDGYRTEMREPPARSPRTREFTNSPPPMDEPLEKSRSSSKYTPKRPQLDRRTTSTTYSYADPPQPASRRPSYQHERSSRSLYGEVPTLRPSPRPEDFRTSPSIRQEDVKMSSGYRTVRPDRHYERQSSAVYAR